MPPVEVSARMASPWSQHRPAPMTPAVSARTGRAARYAGFPGRLVGLHPVERSRFVSHAP